MKFYHTLCLDWNESPEDLKTYFSSMNIEYRMSAELNSFAPRGHIGPRGQIGSGAQFDRTFEVLLDEEDLTVIKLSYPDVQFVENRGGLVFRNKLRKMLQQAAEIIKK